MPISSMLVPIGLDERDAKVLKYVCGLGAQSVRRVLVATSVDVEGLEAPVIPAEVDRARERLAAMAASLRPCRMEIEWRVVTGNPSESLLALAQQADVDVICCGTEGKSLVDYLFSGSVSEDIFSSGRVRTMTVRYDLLEDADDPGELAESFGRRLVVPVDFSASSTRAFLSAFDRPASAMDTLYVVHVVEADASDEDKMQAEVLIKGQLAIAREHGVECQVDIRTSDDAEQAVLDYLDEVDATGVITGMRGKGVLRGVMIGSLSMRLLREARCPVVVQP